MRKHINKLKQVTKKGINKGKFGYNIAIDIRFKKIYIAISENKKLFYELIEVAEHNIPEDIKKQEKEFLNWLKDIIAPYKHKYPRAFYWFLLSSQHVKSHILTLPSVPNNKLEDLIYLTFKKEHQIDPHENIIDYYVIGDKLVKNIKRLEVFAVAAKKNEVKRLQSLARHLDLPAFGVTSYDLAVSNLFINKKQSVAHVFLGTDWSRIDIYRDGYLVLSRDIKTGFVSIAEEFQEKTRQREYEISFEELEETNKGLTLDEVKKIFSNLDGAQGIDVFDNILTSTIQRFILQLRRTINFYEANIGKDKVTELYFSGIIDIPEILLRRIQENLDLTANKLTPTKMRLVASSYSQTLTPFQEMEFAPVIGCSVCPSSRFNFLYTSKDKAKKKLQKYISICISSFFVLLFVILAGYYVYLSNDLNNNLKIKEYYLKKIREQKPLVTEDLLKNLLKNIEKENIKLKNSIQIYEPIAIIKDISNKTPDKIKWNRFELNDNKKILIDALIKKSSTSKMEMADYLLHLKYSPFVKDASIVKQETRYIEKEPYDFISVEILLK